MVFLLAGLSFSGNLNLPNIFADSMVLQRDIVLPVWGKGIPGSKVAVTIGKEKGESTVGADSNWIVNIKPKKAGGPYIMKVISETDTLTLRDIVFGDVWFASGQSNMEFSCGEFSWAASAAKEAVKSDLRIFKVKKTIDFNRRYESECQTWKAATGDNILKFSAVGYWFGKYLRDNKNVPIGIIQSAWGGTAIEPWTSAEGFAKLSDYAPIIDSMKKIMTTQEEYRKKRAAAYKEWVNVLYRSGMGMREKWYLPDTILKGWTDVIVPGIWDTLPGMKGFCGTAWYKRSVYIPAELSKKPLRLLLGKITKHDLTWINGTYVGEMYAYHKERDYKISVNAVKEGWNDLTVRVVSRTGSGGFALDTGYMMICADTAGYPSGNVSLLHGTWKMKVDPELDTALLPQRPDTSIGPSDAPALLFNGMVSPYVNYKLKGFIWYQGESNVSRAADYARLFPNMITDWRREWKQGDLPFLFVQLANFYPEKKDPDSSGWAELRESQTAALKLPKTALATAIDIGNPNDIHPANKEEVGRRLALAARKIAYNEKIVHSGPQYTKFTKKGKNITIEFNCFGSALKKSSERINGFAIAGDDKVFHWADAKIVNNTVVVNSREVNNPVAVRYAWANNPGTLQLYNTNGLPALPFRTDNWPLSTEGKRFQLR
ncbi:MAG: sialate O-acetylesterase [Fibrobacteres bacterium]|nr:sialate O-acetylesterase [Fibrobacterota bacterium]